MVKAKLAEAIAVAEKVPCALLMPAAWTAADISFQASLDGGATWHDVYDMQGNNLVLVNPQVGTFYQLDPSQFAGLTVIRLQSGDPGAQVNQVAAAAVTLATRKYYSV